MRYKQRHNAKILFYNKTRSYLHTYNDLLELLLQIKNFDRIGRSVLQTLAHSILKCVNPGGGGG